MEIKGAYVIATALVAIVIGAGIGYLIPRPAPPAPPAPTPTPTEKVTLRYWTGDWNKRGYESMIKLFEQIYPNIDIEVDYLPWVGMWDKILVGLQSENPPDLVDTFYTYTPGFVEKGLLENLDERVGEIEGWTEDWYEAPLINAKAGTGSFYAVPIRADSHIMWYNTRLFREAGVKKVPETWDELIDAGLKLKAIGAYLMGTWFGEATLGTQYFGFFLYGNGGKFLSDDGKKVLFNSAAGVQALQFIVDLKNKYDMLPPTVVSDEAKEARELYAGGRVGIVIDSIMVYGMALDAGMPREDIGWTFIPWSSTETYKKVPNSFATSQSISIAAGSKHKEEAWTFIKWWSQGPIQTYYGRALPVRKSEESHLRYTQSPLVSTSTEQLKWAWSMPCVPYLAEMCDAVQTAIIRALLGEMTPKEALDQAATTVEGLISK